MITLELSEKDRDVLLALINIAVKTVGLEAAEAGVYFVHKLKDATPVT